MNSTWKKIKCRKKDLQLAPTLSGGQSFRWKKNEENMWTGVFNNSVWQLMQTDDHLLYQRFPASQEIKEEDCNIPRKRKASNIDMHLFDSEEDEEKCLKLYFRLDVDLKEHYENWSGADINFKEAANKFYGIRILCQDVVENVFSFICSSNNNITRISSMVEKLCTMYGNPIATVNNHQYFSFPALDRLSGPSVESDLRRAGFGYRAKFISQSSQVIEQFGGLTWLNQLKSLAYQDAKTGLMKLPGIGAKVADCICLMSLGHLEAIPVDTHIFQIAQQSYLPHLKPLKSVTGKAYNEIGQHFRQLFGSYAGWAHTILFCADLKQFHEDNDKKKRRTGGKKCS